MGGCRDFNGPFPQSLVMSRTRVGRPSHDVHTESTIWMPAPAGGTSGGQRRGQPGEQLDHTGRAVDDDVGELLQVGLLVGRRADDEPG